jgi:hypothetical protein
MNVYTVLAGQIERCVWGTKRNLPHLFINYGFICLMQSAPNGNNLLCEACGQSTSQVRPLATGPPNLRFLQAR